MKRDIHVHFIRTTAAYQAQPARRPLHAPTAALGHND